MLYELIIILKLAQDPSMAFHVGRYTSADMCLESAPRQTIEHAQMYQVHLNDIQAFCVPIIEQARKGTEVRYEF